MSELIEKRARLDDKIVRLTSFHFSEQTFRRSKENYLVPISSIEEIQKLLAERKALDNELFLAEIQEREAYENSDEMLAKLDKAKADWFNKNSGLSGRDISLKFDIPLDLLNKNFGSIIDCRKQSN